MNVIITSISHQQIYDLEQIFATMNETGGWNIPDWLIELKRNVK